MRLSAWSSVMPYSSAYSAMAASLSVESSGCALR